MSQNLDFQHTLRRAKQQRAELIGSALRSHVVAAAFVAVLSIVMTQVATQHGAGSPRPVEATHTHAEPTSDSV